MPLFTCKESLTCHIRYQYYIGLTIIFVTLYLYVIVNHCNYCTLIFIYALNTADWQSKARANKSLKPENVYNLILHIHTHTY